VPGGSLAGYENRPHIDGPQPVGLVDGRVLDGAADEDPGVVDQDVEPAHGLRARIIRAFQQIGYDETTLAIYDEALNNGDLLLQVPVRPAERRRIVALLQRHDVHDLGYFGQGTFEQFPILDAD